MYIYMYIYMYMLQHRLTLRCTDVETHYKRRCNALQAHLKISCRNVKLLKRLDKTMGAKNSESGKPAVGYVDLSVCPTQIVWLYGGVFK